MHEDNLLLRSAEDLRLAISLCSDFTDKKETNESKYWISKTNPPF